MEGGLKIRYSKRISNQISKVNTKFCAEKYYLPYFASKTLKLHKTLVHFLYFMNFLHFDFLAYFSSTKKKKRKIIILKFQMNNIFNQIFNKSTNFLGIENAHF